ncbi:hypothetical protein MPL3356_600009 [Mesorhizobium plurifarium]|uniref:Uncharacterized protein n=1 Tax=Mesorhizobium plurifarium TaxID=69974 RepID=A0A090EGA8_MESPL|nr:hypothetical protein MPLB_1480007 [Mesorhizobium sp. ORS 3324]CDX27263.1 hypothetical protein MPL3356_600009 [Mesorhizobium plurifarium]
MLPPRVRRQSKCISSLTSGAERLEDIARVNPFYNTRYFFRVSKSANLSLNCPKPT